MPKDEVEGSGAREIATARSADKAAVARARGADQVVMYDGFADAVCEVAGGGGVDVVFDSIRRSLSAYAWPR